MAFVDDRRRWHRIAGELRLTVSVVGASGETLQILPAVGRGLNPEGICIETTGRLEIGEKVRVTLAMEATSGILTCEGKVTERLPPDDHDVAQFGIHFESTGGAWLRLYQWLKPHSTLV